MRAMNILVLMSDRIRMPRCKPLADDMKNAPTMTVATTLRNKGPASMPVRPAIPPAIDIMPAPRLAAHCIGGKSDPRRGPRNMQCHIHLRLGHIIKINHDIGAGDRHLSGHGDAFQIKGEFDPRRGIVQPVRQGFSPQNTRPQHHQNNHKTTSHAPTLDQRRVNDKSTLPATDKSGRFLTMTEPARRVSVVEIDREARDENDGKSCGDWRR